MAVTTVLPTSIAKIFVRVLTQEDISTLQQLCVDCTDFHVLTEGIEPDSNKAAKLFTDCPPGKTPQDKQLIGLFTGDEQMIGAIDLLMDYPEKRIWYMGLLMLHPQWRGKGLGLDTVLWVEDYLSTKDVDHLCLAVLDVNPKAKKFWENTGFRQVREVHDYQSGNLKTSAYVMKKQIGTAPGSKLAL